MQSPADAPIVPSRRRIVLAMLLLVYVLNFVDRQILSILADPIKRDLHLSDTALGMLGGLAFAMLYTVLAVPMALLSDRTGRSWMIGASLAVFSLFSALCGAARGFWSLFVFRLGVGFGEAGGVAPAYALIADYYPSERRARAMAIYSLGIPLGLTAGAVVGGALLSVTSWRWAFVCVGLAGILVVAPFAWLVRDVAPAGRARPGRSADVAASLRTIVRTPAFWPLSCAAASSSLVGYGLAFWVPSLLLRSYGLEIGQASRYFGSLVLIGGTVGVLAGGWLADRLGFRSKRAYALLPATAWLLSVPTFLIAFLVPRPGVAWAFFLIPNALNILWIAPVTTAIQHIVPEAMRATASACFLLVNNLLGLGLGAVVIGAMSDLLAQRLGTDALRAAAMSSLVFYLIAAVLAFVAAPRVARGWIEDGDTIPKGNR